MIACLWRPSLSCRHVAASRKVTKKSHEMVLLLRYNRIHRKSCPFCVSVPPSVGVVGASPDGGIGSQRRIYQAHGKHSGLGSSLQSSIRGTYYVPAFSFHRVLTSAASNPHHPSTDASLLPSITQHPIKIQFRSPSLCCVPWKRCLLNYIQNRHSYIFRRTLWYFPEKPSLPPFLTHSLFAGCPVTHRYRRTDPSIQPIRRSLNAS